jgi:hypothetical protein
MTLDLRRTVLEVVNEVQRRVGLNTTSTLTATKHATVLLGLLNEVIDDMSDFGNWQEMYAEVVVTAISSTGEYSVNPQSGLVKNIYEVSFNNSVAPLENRDIQDIRRLQRLGSHGTPRQFGIVGVDQSSGNPKIRVHPIPGSNQDELLFNVAIYKKPPLYTTSDTTEEIEFPAATVIQGLYAKALLEENGGEPTPQFQAAFSLYERMKTEALNRYTADTGTDVYFVPNRGRR